MAVIITTAELLNHEFFSSMVSLLSWYFTLDLLAQLSERQLMQLDRTNKDLLMCDFSSDSSPSLSFSSPFSEPACYRDNETIRMPYLKQHRMSRSMPDMATIIYKMRLLLTLYYQNLM